MRCIEQVNSHHTRDIHCRHVHPPPRQFVTVVNSLQNQVNNITLCITLNAKTGKIGLVLVTLRNQIE